MKKVVIIGAGPAGLTAGYCLRQAGWGVTILESDPQYVGGLSRTVKYGEFRFDIGGHRFFTKSREVDNFWAHILGDDLIERPRLSRIYYRGRFYSYPLKALEALHNLGLLESSLCLLSYVKACCFPVKDPQSFEDWVINEFGQKLYRIFFKTYTEKVWGMACKDISADWAAQRIKGLSLGTAVWRGMFSGTAGDTQIKTLINSFKYPRLGPGMMWEKCADMIRDMGGEILLGHQVQTCRQSPGQNWEITTRDANGQSSHVSGDHLSSTTAIRELCSMLDPAPSDDVLRATQALRYRDFVTVALIVKDRLSLPDNWIYVHDPNVKVGRIQNFKSWSPELVPDRQLACYGLEYFCFENDALWSRSDSELVSFAAKEMHQLGLLDTNDLLDGCVVRQPKAYPVYDDEYKSNVKLFVSEIEAKYPTLHLAGRNGMHKYNNQDHAMVTAMLTAKNIIAGQKLYDVWRVNQDAEYCEGGSSNGTPGTELAASGLRMVPSRISQAKPSTQSASAAD
jgi:protoporphyrinogen oxidase